MKFLAEGLFNLYFWVLGLVPTSVRWFLGRLLGCLWFDVFRIRRQVVLDNLQIAFPGWTQQKREQVGRESCEYLGQTLMEYAHLPKMNREWINKHVQFKGIEHVDKALANKTGALFLSLHLGNGDLAISALACLGYPMILISKYFKTKVLNDIWFNFRAAGGTRFIPPENSSYTILKALKRNEVVIFVLDQFMGPPFGVKTKFFGRETGTAAGLAVIAQRSKTPVIPIFCYRTSPDQFVVEAWSALEFQDLGTREESIAVNTQIYTDKIEEIIRLHPAQWMWVHRRWKEFRH